MASKQLSFGEAVEYRGRTAIVVSNGPRVIGGDQLVVDLAVFNQIKDGAGKVKNIVGTAEQDKLVGFLHDIPIDQVEKAEDWFFSLSDEELDGLVKERARRNHEKAQAEQAKLDETEKAQTLQGVKIRPSKEVLEAAENLWKNSIKEAGHADIHDEVVLPTFDANPDAWKPWIERAKQVIAAARKVSGSSAGSKAPFIAAEVRPDPQQSTQPQGGNDPKDDAKNDGGSGSIN